MFKMGNKQNFFEICFFLFLIQFIVATLVNKIKQKQTNKQQPHKNFIGTDNSMVITRGKGGRGR